MKELVGEAFRRKMKASERLVDSKRGEVKSGICESEPCEEPVVQPRCHLNFHGKCNLENRGRDREKSKKMHNNSRLMNISLWLTLALLIVSTEDCENL